jgi:hypothetical protein
VPVTSAARGTIIEHQIVGETAEFSDLLDDKDGEEGGE